MRVNALPTLDLRWPSTVAEQIYGGAPLFSPRTMPDVCKAYSRQLLRDTVNRYLQILADSVAFVLNFDPNPHPAEQFVAH